VLFRLWQHSGLLRGLHRPLHHPLHRPLKGEGRP
jgi:hypothetical protein